MDVTTLESAALLSVVVPVYNEEAVVTAFYQRLRSVLDTLDVRTEIVFVNDGSADGTHALIRELQRGDSRVAVLDLSRNFGKEAALTAGLDHARGDAIVVIDADLQDPPELIPLLLQKWREGYDVVYAVRSSRNGESWLKKLTAYTFYRVMSHTGPVAIPQDTGDFRLLSRRAVLALGKLRERHRFMKGLFAWIGYRQTGVSYERDPRHSGYSKWSYWKLWNLALEGVSSFTTLPLRLSTYIGFLTAAGAFVYGLSIIWKTLLHSNPVPGYPSLLVVILFLGGIQLMSLGVIGEYLGRMFDEAKQRPLYLVADYEPAREARGTEVTANPASENTPQHDMTNA
ncbi:MAG: glycosyltransferase family 2 protein [bacterium]|nr:glycosyltransferase family 2 protein [bacterium]